MDSLIASSGSRLVSVVPSNATEFSQNQKAIIELDASLGYIKGRDTYLCLDVLNNSADSGMWSFPQGVGASALINRIDIYSKMTGQHLETLENYNQWACVEIQHSTDDFTTLQQLEGVGSPAHQWQSVYNGANNIHSKVLLDPRQIENTMVSPLNANQKDPIYATRRFVIQLKAGVFRSWDSEQITPCLNLGGLRIEIIFETNALVCKRLCAVGSLPASPNTQIDLVATGISCADIATGNNIATVLTNEGVAGGYFTNIQDMGLCVGNVIQISATGLVNPVQVTITNLEDQGTAGRKRITFAPTFNALADLTNVTVKVVNSTSYIVKGVEMRVAVMMVPDSVRDQLKGQLMFEFTSYDHFLDTVPSTVLRHQVPINSVASKARAIFSHFYDVNNESAPSAQSYYSGVSPTEMFLNSVQFFINNRLYPLRAYNPGCLADKPIVFNELVKACKSAGILPINLGSNEAGNLNDYSNSFMVARELARGVYVADLRNAEPEIRLGFSAVRSGLGQIGNVRVNTYVFSRKVVNMGMSGVAVEL